MAGEKPALKVSIKAKDQGAQSVSLFAFWPGENGSLRGRLDRRVVELAAKLEDGSIVRIKRAQDGRESMWINAYLSDVPAPAPQPRPAPQRATAPLFDAGPDGGLDPDDMPF